MTPMQGGVFAAGDVVTGPATVIDAIAAGHRAADRSATTWKKRPARADEQRLGAKAAPTRIRPARCATIGAGTASATSAMPLVPGREFAEHERSFGAAEATR